ncbi:MAG: cytochrome d ubiquinol oxidase subunit II, partial [Candidatus Omnitrophota bacterium]
AVAALGLCGIQIFRKSHFWAFWSSGAAIVIVTALVFTHLYPNVLVSSLDPKWNLTIYNSSASPYSLKVMSVVAILFIPTVLLYQGWTYWILRKRIQKTDLDY